MNLHQFSESSGSLLCRGKSILDNVCMSIRRLADVHFSGPSRPGIRNFQIPCACSLLYLGGADASRRLRGLNGFSSSESLSFFRRRTRSSVPSSEHTFLRCHMDDSAHPSKQVNGLIIIFSKRDLVTSPTGGSTIERAPTGQSTVPISITFTLPLGDSTYFVARDAAQPPK